MKMGVYVFRSCFDCSLNGITSKNDRLEACWNENDIFELPEDMEGCDIVIKADSICGGRKTIRAFVIDHSGEKPKALLNSGMAGGNFVYTCDSRFPKLGDFGEPISVHDRFESEEYYKHYD